MKHIDDDDLEELIKESEKMIADEHDLIQQLKEVMEEEEIREKLASIRVDWGKLSKESQEINERLAETRDILDFPCLGGG